MAWTIVSWASEHYKNLCAVVREVNGDDAGRLSQMRLSNTAVVMVVLGVYIWKNAQAGAGTMVDFPENAAWLLGITITGKVAQKFIEKKWGGVSQAVQAVNSAPTPDPIPVPSVDDPCPKAY